MASLRDRLRRTVGEPENRAGDAASTFTEATEGEQVADREPEDSRPDRAVVRPPPPPGKRRVLPPPPSVGERLRRLHRSRAPRRWNYGTAPPTDLRGTRVHHGYGNPRANTPGDRVPTAAPPVPRSVQAGDLGGVLQGRLELPGDHRHGDLFLRDVLEVDGAGAVLVGGDAELVDFDPLSALFFDLETTGLPGRGDDEDPSATLAILIGAVRVTPGGGAVVHHILMRDTRDEPAALRAFEALLDGVTTLVSFNGKSFDRHVLADRFAMQRLDGERLRTMPHLDLIHPARRLYRRSMESCSLTALEREHLGVFRAEDIPGSEVPARWRSFARTADIRHVEPVLDHNTLDLLTLLTLAAHLVRCVRAPGARLLHASSLAAAGKLLLERSDSGRGEALLRTLVDGAADDAEPSVYGSLHLLAEHLRKSERYAEAVELWRRMRRVAGLSDLRPWRGEAIALEHRLDRVDEARALVERLMEDAAHAGRLWDPDVKEFEGRLARLRRKSAAGTSPSANSA